jgi:hypothetical protein
MAVFTITIILLAILAGAVWALRRLFLWVGIKRGYWNGE